MESIAQYSGLTNQNLHAQRTAFNELLQANGIANGHLVSPVDFPGNSRSGLLNSVDKIQYKVSALRHVHEFGLTPEQLKVKDVNAQLDTRTQLARKQLLEKYSSEDSHIKTLEESKISLECNAADDRVTFLAIGKINGNTFEIFHQHEEHEYGSGKWG